MCIQRFFSIKPSFKTIHTLHQPTNQSKFCLFIHSIRSRRKVSNNNGITICQPPLAATRRSSSNASVTRNNIIEVENSPSNAAKQRGKRKLLNIDTSCVVQPTNQPSVGDGALWFGAALLPWKGTYLLHRVWTYPPTPSRFETRPKLCGFADRTRRVL